MVVSDGRNLQDLNPRVENDRIVIKKDVDSFVTSKANKDLSNVVNTHHKNKFLEIGSDGRIAYRSISNISLVKQDGTTEYIRIVVD